MDLTDDTLEKLKEGQKQIREILEMQYDALFEVRSAIPRLV